MAPLPFPTLASDPRSDRDQLAMLAPDFTQSIADLAHCGIGLDCVDDRKHEILLAPGGVLNVRQGRRPKRRVTLSPDFLNSRDLTPLAFRVDALEGRGRGLPSLHLFVAPPPPSCA